MRGTPAWRTIRPFINAGRTICCFTSDRPIPVASVSWIMMNWRAGLWQYPHRSGDFAVCEGALEDTAEPDPGAPPGKWIPLSSPIRLPVSGRTAGSCFSTAPIHRTACASESPPQIPGRGPIGVSRTNGFAVRKRRLCRGSLCVVDGRALRNAGQGHARRHHREKHAGAHFRSDDGLECSRSIRPRLTRAIFSLQMATGCCWVRLRGRNFSLMATARRSVFLLRLRTAPGGFHNATTTWNIAIPLENSEQRLPSEAICI